jgi:hypothetical protein
MAKSIYTRMQFFQLISMGPEKIEQCFDARFNNQVIENNYSKEDQEVFLQVLKEVLNSDGHYQVQWTKIGAPYNLDDLIEFTNTNNTIKRLEQDSQSAIIGEMSDSSEGSLAYDAT